MGDPTGKIRAMPGMTPAGKRHNFRNSGVSIFETGTITSDHASEYYVFTFAFLDHGSSSAPTLG
jgi:hypothetical protein